MGLNALLEGVSSSRSGVLLSVDKSFSPTVSPVTAQITGLNEAVGFSVRFDGFSDRFDEAFAAAERAPSFSPAERAIPALLQPYPSPQLDSQIFSAWLCPTQLAGGEHDLCS